MSKVKASDETQSSFHFELERLSALIGTPCGWDDNWQIKLLVTHRHKLFDIQEQFSVSRIELVEEGILVFLETIQFIIQSDDEFFVAWEVFARLCYKLPAYNQLTVLDIGANTGISALWFLLHGAEFVLCCEPNPHALKLLRQNLRLNPQFREKYSINPSAAWKDSGIKEAFFFQEHPACGYLDDPSILRSTTQSSTPHKEEIQTVDVDMLVDDLLCATSSGPLALKLDCEGSELRILNRLNHRDRIAAFQHIVIETHDGSDSLVSPLLAKNGFAIDDATAEFAGTKLFRWTRQTDTPPPQVSVIVPAYNARLTIVPTVESILSQTYRDLELIVVDDGSTDDTVSILERITDPRLKVISTVNGGQARARNVGIKAARGHYVGFCDADDLWLPRKLQRQIRTLKLHPECELTYSWAALIDEAGSTLQVASTTAVKGNIFFHLFMANFFECGSTPLATREVLDTVGLFDESVTRSEDWDMWLRMAKVTQIISTPFIDILYRQSRTSQSTNVNKLAISCYDVHRKFRAQVPKEFIAPAHRNVAVYLAFKAIEPNGGPLLSLRYLAKALWHYPLFFIREPRAYRVALRILAQLFLPSAAIELAIPRAHDALNVDSLLGIVGTTVEEILS